MKFIDEYRSAPAVKKVIDAIEQITTQNWTIMEIHGPGCPVCVTPVNLIDQAIHIANQDNTILTTFGDMSRVPGSKIDLLSAKACGADVRTVYSPLDAIRLAEEHPNRQVVFFAVGFETTAPATALVLEHARKKDLRNFSTLVAHVRVPPAITAILSAPECMIQGFLAAGHVCTIMGTDEYLPLVEQFNIPMVITGFEPLDIVQGVYQVIQQLEQSHATLDNQYARAVTAPGNGVAKALLNRVFETTSRDWRGIGTIPDSGLRLTKSYRGFDASVRFPYPQANLPSTGNRDCISGKILTGQARPSECTQFAKRCIPEHPLGAPMVSSEGACAAYYRHRKQLSFSVDNSTTQHSP